MRTWPFGVLGAAVIALAVAAATGLLAQDYPAFPERGREKGIYSADLAAKELTYAIKLEAEWKGCRRDAFEHDLKNLEALAEIARQRETAARQQAIQDLKASGKDPAAIEKEIDRQRSTNSPYGQSYSDSISIDKALAYFRSMAWKHCQSPATRTAQAPTPVAPQPAPVNGGCFAWIDAATGQAVPTGPGGWLPGGGSTPGGRFSNPDPNHVVDSQTGRTFVRDPQMGWIDAATGQAVPTGPGGWLPGGGSTPGGRFSNPDPNHVVDGQTGRTFVRVPCPPPAPPPPSVRMTACNGQPLSPMTPFSQAVLDDLNAARADPGAYARSLDAYRTYFHGNLVKEPGRPLIATNEGVTAVDNAIAFLTKQPPLPPLLANPVLTETATTFVAHAGPAGVMGHTGPDGKDLSQRLKASCFIASYMGEVIAYRQAVAAAVVRQLIIDDGLLTRLHRSDIFSPVAKQAGVGCGPHATQGTMCAIDLASASFGAATTPTMSLSAYHSRLDALHGQYGVAGCNKIEDSVSLDDSNNPLDAKIVWFCKDFDLPLYEVKVNGAGDVTGNGQTTAFRAYMTMKAAVDGGYIYGAFSYGNNADGRYVEHAVVEDKEGHKRGVFDFNADGTVKTGETFNVEGQRVGVISGP